LLFSRISGVVGLFVLLLLLLLLFTLVILLLVKKKFELEVLFGSVVALLIELFSTLFVGLQ
jgi:hypothetical protein